MLLISKSGSQRQAIIKEQSLSQDFGAVDSSFASAFFAFPRAQSLQGLNIPERWQPLALPVALVITSNGWPNSACRTLMFFHCGLCQLSLIRSSFLKELDSSYPTIMSLNYAIHHNIPTWSLYHDVIFAIAQCFTFFQDFAYKPIGEVLNRPQYVLFFAALNLMHFYWKFALFCSRHIAQTSLYKLVDINHVIRTCVIVGNMAWGYRIANPCVLFNEQNVSPWYMLFEIIINFFITSLFLFSVMSKCGARMSLSSTAFFLFIFLFFVFYNNFCFFPFLPQW